MDLGSIFLILALMVLVGLFVSRPLFERSQKIQNLGFNPDQVERSALLAEQDRVLTSLQELDFDHTMGKIPEEDYPEQRQILLQDGVEILRSLDSFESNASQEENIEDRIKQAIAARRADSDEGDAGGQAGKAPPSPDDDIEVLLANRRRARQEKAVGFCPQCGGPLHKSDRFCPKCGAALA